MERLWIVTTAVLLLGVLRPVYGQANTYTLKTYQGNPLYLKGRQGGQISCKKNENGALKFNILPGITGNRLQVSFRSADFSRYYMAESSGAMKLLLFQNSYSFAIYGSFRERRNYYFQGTVSYESADARGYFIMCKGDKLVVDKPKNSPQKSRASFVTDQASTGQDMWGPCSRTCGGGTQTAKNRICVFGICEEIRTRACNTQKCVSDDPCQFRPCQNGGTCDAIRGGGFRCNCPRCYSGKRCEIAVNPCDSYPCQNNGKCHKSGGCSYWCECRPGFTGSHCENVVDPCSSYPCENGGTCQTSRDGKSFHCQCAHGYTGPTCSSSIDPCASYPCENGGTCHSNRDGKSFQCQCAHGYTGRTCNTKLNPCNNKPCQNGGTCIQERSGFRCVCPREYTGTFCETKLQINPCDNRPCQNGGTCIQEGNGFICRCRPGYTGHLCQTKTNPCDSDPCQNGGICVRFQDTFRCSCPPGFTGSTCNIRVDPCASFPCLNGGTCISQGNSFRCQCTPQFAGQTCETRLNPCDNQPCQNGGTCIPERSGFRCVCHRDYTGPFCENKLQTHPCDLNPCQNGGTCVRFTNTFACNCPSDFTGPDCSTAIQGGCTSGYCRNGGTCIETSNGRSCKCPIGYDGPRCDNRLQAGQWSTCSRTCGKGTRYQICRSNDSRGCTRKYEDCEMKKCPAVTCSTSSKHKFGTNSECCTTTSSSSCGVPAPSSRRIFGGVESRHGQWPWQVAMWNKVPKIYFCGGALVSTRWVVTAGHCASMGGATMSNMEIVGGIIVLEGSATTMQKSDVEKIILHPTYKNPVDDVGLLKLKTAFTITSYVRPICFPNSEVVDEDVICYAAGWGASTDEDRTARRPSVKLLHVGLRILPRDACTQGFQGTGFESGVTDRILCAGVLAGGKDTCIGDSGGPIVCQRKSSCQWFFAGIGSFGPTQCGIGYIPAVFMDVQKYETWIKQQISSN